MGSRFAPDLQPVHRFKATDTPSCSSLLLYSPHVLAGSRHDIARGEHGRNPNRPRIVPRLSGSNQILHALERKTWNNRNRRAQTEPTESPGDGRSGGSP